MKIEVKLTYDDRKLRSGEYPLNYHRKNIGISESIETSIATRYYPNANDWKTLVATFPRKGAYYVASMQLEGNHTLVATNKNNLTKMGTELVNAGIEVEIQRLFDGPNVPNPVSAWLESGQFAKLSFSWEDGQITFLEGAIYQMSPNHPNGLKSKRAPAIGV